MNAPPSNHLPLNVRLDLHTSPEPMSGCWLWTAGLKGGGYGALTVAGRGAVGAHRLSFERHRGPIPAGLFVCHRCDNRACVNPDHLFLGTKSENTKDMCRKGRHAKGVRCGRSRDSRLTDASVAALRAAVLTGGFSQRECARWWGVHPATVNRIVTRKIWRHV